MTETRQTIVALYDTQAHAEAAIGALRTANVPDASISHHQHHAPPLPGTAPTTTSLAGEPISQPSASKPSFWKSLFGGDEYEPATTHDPAVYDRSLESGSTAVVVRDVPPADVTAVEAILERYSPIDIDERATGYGMTGTTATTGAAAGTLAGATGSTMAGGAMAGSNADSTVGSKAENLATRAKEAITGHPTTGSAETMASTGQSTGQSTAQSGMGAAPMAAGSTETIALAAEQLAVGKRVVNQGGTRIRRYVVETPVQQDVTLRQETVQVERRPVAEGAAVADADFSERTIEMTATSEEAVVGKTARVVEEVSLRKEVGERTETVSDTVREQKVEVVPLDTATAPTAPSITPPRSGRGG